MRHAVHGVDLDLAYLLDERLELSDAVEEHDLEAVGAEGVEGGALKDDLRPVSRGQDEVDVDNINPSDVGLRGVYLKGVRRVCIQHERA